MLEYEFVRRNGVLTGPSLLIDPMDVLIVKAGGPVVVFPELAVPLAETTGVSLFELPLCKDFELVDELRLRTGCVGSSISIIP